MKTLLKDARELKNLKTREVAQLLGIDQALISKFESGTRKPTKDQISKLAILLEIDFETIMVSWLKEKILHEIGQEKFALKALQAAKAEINSNNTASVEKIAIPLQKKLDEIHSVKAKMNTLSLVENSNYERKQRRFPTLSSSN
jgi:transcriptional regulator with XRE-family HTH domain